MTSARKQQQANVSVIIPCYQCADTIERCFQSVLRQTLMPKEIILVDDCSADQTLEQLKLLQRMNQTKVDVFVLAADRNGGAGVARNLGWEHASSEYIAFLDADDSWHPDKLRVQYDWMAQNTVVDLSCHMTAINEAEHTEKSMPNMIAQKIDKYALLLQNKVATRTVMLKRNVPYRFDPNKRLSEDYLLWLRMALANAHLSFLNQTLAYSYKPDFGHSGLTASLIEMEKAELDTFNQLLKSKLIAWYWWLLAVVFSAVKFVRRIIILAVKGDS